MRPKDILLILCRGACNIHLHHKTSIRKLGTRIQNLLGSWFRSPQNFQCCVLCVVCCVCAFRRKPFLICCSVCRVPTVTRTHSRAITRHRSPQARDETGDGNTFKTRLLTTSELSTARGVSISRSTVVGNELHQFYGERRAGCF